jgi:hypothetical protein
MSSYIAEVNGSRVIDAEFIKMVVTYTNGTTTTQRTFRFSNSYRQETIEGELYDDLGALMSVGNYQRSIAPTTYDTSIGVTGLDPNYLFMVAGAPLTSPMAVKNQPDIPIGYWPMLKGSLIQIRRGFYNDNYQLTTALLRYSGIVTSFNIKEERDGGPDAKTDNYTIVIQCSALSRVLQNRLSGRSTNSKSWKQYNPNDTSMDRVTALETKAFDFGKDV